MGSWALGGLAFHGPRHSNTSSCLECTAGRYNEASGAADAAACTACPAGTEGSEGATSLSSCRPCEAGWAAPEGSATCSTAACHLAQQLALRPVRSRHLQYAWCVCPLPAWPVRHRRGAV